MCCFQSAAVEYQWICFWVIFTMHLRQTHQHMWTICKCTSRKKSSKVGDVLDTSSYNAWIHLKNFKFTILTMVFFNLLFCCYEYLMSGLCSRGFLHQLDVMHSLTWWPFHYCRHNACGKIAFFISQKRKQEQQSMASTERQKWPLYFSEDKCCNWQSS